MVYSNWNSNFKISTKVWENDHILCKIILNIQKSLRNGSFKLKISVWMNPFFSYFLYKMILQDDHSSLSQQFFCLQSANSQAQPQKYWRRCLEQENWKTLLSAPKSREFLRHMQWPIQKEERGYFFLPNWKKIWRNGIFNQIFGSMSNKMFPSFQNFSICSPKIFFWGHISWKYTRIII